VDDEKQPTVASPIKPVVILRPEAAEVNYDEWVNQSEYSIFDLCSGSCVIIMFRDKSNGITKDNGTTIDISWMRTGDKIHATCGDYLASDIIGWKAI
tara:strand:+ start:848 stop:1138 length:291 start_codon:yes stop_codon:yes gene_type:complete